MFFARRIPALFLFSLLTGAVILMAPEAAAQTSHPWQFKRDKDGIRVEIRKVEGSSIDEYRGEMTLPDSLDRVVNFYENDGKVTEWFYNCKGYRLFRRESEARQLYYFELEMPWPVSDRDVVFARQRSRDPDDGSVLFEVREMPGEMPEQEDRVRMTALRGFWRFTPLPDGGTRVTLQQHGEPAGRLPAALVNRLVVDIPYHTLDNFRRQLSREGSSV